MDTYYEGQNVERFLKHTMEFLYARTILELLSGVVKKDCYGCEDHLVSVWGRSFEGLHHPTPPCTTITTM
jgi:hypothetical protein